MARRHFVFECTASDSTGCLRSVGLCYDVRDFEWYNLHGRGETVPGDDDDTEDAGDTTEYEGDDATGGETVKIRFSNSLTQKKGGGESFSEEGEKERGMVSYPPGIVPGDLFWPERSKKSTVLPAALPFVRVLEAAQTERWSSGMVSCFWMSRGASTKVARRPEATCHSR